MNSDSHLRYLDAARVDTPVGSLTAMSLISPSDKNIGSLSGIIIDPIEQQVRYFVVQARRWWTTRRYLLAVTPTPIDSDRQGLHVEFESQDLKRLPKFQPHSFSPFSDEDLRSTFFSPSAA